MKRKVRVKSLPKAQTGLQAPMVLTPEQKAIWLKNQGMFGADYILDTPKVFDNSPSFKLGEPKVFDNPSVNPFNKSPKLSLYPRNTKFESGILSTGDAIKKINLDKIPEDTRKVMGLEPFGDIKIKKPEEQTGNPYVGPALLAATDVFSSVARKFQDRDAKRNLKDQFLSDNLYTSRPEDYSGNRGDYTVNTPGFGDYFRPDEHVYGDYNKIARMGGEMKRKIKITSLPQAAYGGSQNAKAVNQLYGNSSYMTSMFNGTNKDESEEQYNQTLNADPRSTAVLEAEKGETLVRKGTSDSIPQFFKVGGKRHSQGGTPLSGEKATPDSFIYSDTKAMKIKDPTILESFGFSAKKGGYTPAKISKKFDLNSKELREGLYSQDDPLRKSTSVLMADNYISNLGKLALVQESQKGFPQGVPEIAMPYMDKVGLDPAQFLPPSPEEGMMMAMYGGIPKAQVGKSVLTNTSGSYPAKQSLNQFMTPSPYYRENNFGPTAGMAIGPDGKHIKLRDDVFNWDAVYNVSNKPIGLKPFDLSKVSELDWSLLDDPSFQGYNSVPNKSQVIPVQQSAVQKARPVTQTPKPKVNVTKPNTGYTTPEGSVVEFEYGGIPLAQDGTQAGEFLAKHTDDLGREYSSYLQGDKVVLIGASGEIVSSRPATEKDKPAINTYDEEEKKLLRSIAPNLILPEDYVEGIQKSKVSKIPGTYGRFDKASADKNWSWYNKPIDWSDKLQVGDAQLGYNSEMYNRFIKAGYTPQEAARYVKTIGFDTDKKEGPNAYDSMAGKYTETRVVFDVPKKPTVTPDGDIIYWCTPGANGEAGISGQGKKEDKPANAQVFASAGLRDASCEKPKIPPPPIPRRPIGFYPQDVLNTAAAVGDLASINKYNPRMIQFNPQPMKPTYYDPNRELANNAEMVNIATGNLAQFTGPQAFNSRFSDLQGKGLANAANIEARYNNLNVGVANQFEQANKQLMNDGNFRNQLAANDFYDKTVTANQQFDNSKRQGRRQVVDYANAALDNRFITDQMNSLYPNYFVDPAMLKTFYNPNRQITPQQRGQDMMTYLESTGIPFDFSDPAVQAALLKGIMGDVDVDERGNMVGSQAAMSQRRKRKSS
jgi:hypothetical protein